MLLDLLDRDLERPRERDLGESRGYTDPHRAGGELEQRVAARGVEPVEQSGQFDRGGLAVHGVKRRDRFGHARRVGAIFAPRP